MSEVFTEVPALWTGSVDRLLVLVVKASSSRTAGPGSIPVFPVVIFPNGVIPVTSKLVLQWLPCQAPGDIRTALGLVGPVSVVYCDCARQKV